jgi:2-oxoisovalerate dehydrogenase E1 component
VFVAGIDVAAGGNVFGLTRGLHERFGDRVRDTPISESAIVGLGVGAAMAGMRPVVELMYLDFIGVCLDQLLNQAAKLPFMTGGAAQMALTVRTQFGAGRSSGSQHSQSLEALLAHIPGLSVIMPSTPADTYGLLRAIRTPTRSCSSNRLLYGMKGRSRRTTILPIRLRRCATRKRHHCRVGSRMVHEAAPDRCRRRHFRGSHRPPPTVAPLDAGAILESVPGRPAADAQSSCAVRIGKPRSAATVARSFWDLGAPSNSRRRSHSPHPTHPPRARVAPGSP